MKIVSIIKYVFLVLGLAMLTGAFFMYSNTQQFLSNAVATEGTVTELVRSIKIRSGSGDRSRRRTMYTPVVEFKTQTGELVEFTSSSSSNPPSYSRGEVVGVRYLETSPEQAKIYGFFPLWGLSTIFGVQGSILFLIGFSIKPKHRQAGKMD